MWKADFCNTFHTKCLILEPQTSRFTPQNLWKTWPANTHAKKHNCCAKVGQKHPNGGSEISKINRNPSLDPQGLLPCAPKSPCIARWSPRCQIGRNKHAKWHVLGTKFDNIRASIHRELKNTWRRNFIQTSASQHTFQQRYFKKHPTNYKLKVKGAGGMDEALR